MHGESYESKTLNRRGLLVAALALAMCATAAGPLRPDTRQE